MELVLGSSEGTHHRLEHRLTKIHSLKNSNRSFENDQQELTDRLDQIRSPPIRHGSIGFAVKPAPLQKPEGEYATIMAPVYPLDLAEMVTSVSSTV